MPAEVGLTVAAMTIFRSVVTDRRRLEPITKRSHLSLCVEASAVESAVDLPELVVAPC
jgi:hypothetical protein